MEQVLEKEAIYTIIPEIEEKAEKVKEKPKKIKRNSNLGNTPRNTKRESILIK